MRFSLQDVRKQVRRRDGELSVSLHFLTPGELHDELETLVTYHEQHIGRPRKSFSPDDARACIGDYRLAHCLMSTLGAWYRWQSRAWHQALEGCESAAQLLLNSAAITGPVQLRLAFFDYVNLHHAGFLMASQRSEAMAAFAAGYRLRPHELEALLVLDSEEEEVLTREPATRPLPPDVINLYNQWVFEAALGSSSQVRLTIDCEAFARQSQADQRQPTGSGVGSVIKRLAFLARRLGVYYDLSYSHAPAGRVPFLQLILYGPQEMTGAPQQYGLRLARLCRQLLGYGSTRGAAAQSSARAHGRTLDGAVVSAEATLHFLQRAYRFSIDNALLTLLTPPATGQSREKPAPAPVFDSGIEEAFAAAFASLEHSQAVDGWHLLREPEPLLLTQGIFIPDFALTRGEQRIFVEILGFWTPSYRERKLHKLQQLQGRSDILLAIPLEARQAFASLEAHFPIVWYAGQLSASELLRVMRQRYDDFSTRLAAIDREAVRRLVAAELIVPERTCYELLHCYRRTELTRAAARITGEEVAFVSGIGLFNVEWMEQLRDSFVEWMGAVRRAALVDVLREVRTRWPDLAACEDAAIEAILGLWPQVRVQRSSIFEGYVELTAHAPEVVAAVPAQPGRKAAPARRAGPTKQRPAQEATQQDLWRQ